MRQIKRIFVHCTASSQKWGAAELRAEFRRKGWTHPGYHYIITAAGKIERMLSEDQVSNGVQGYNSTAINVAYVGGIDSAGNACDNRTKVQKEQLRFLIDVLHQKYPDAVILGHRDIWGTDKRKWKKLCPCFDAQKEYADL